jgi:hypothetical protein
VCPAHPNSTVWFDGTYGRPPHRRQRYKCIPPDGGAIHRFTEPLPRQMTASGECDECERGLHPHEGPPTPRRFDYAAREIARALIAVGSGFTYRRAGRDTRVRTQRLRYTQNGKLKRNDDGNTVGDWVEVFAPLIFERHRPTSWPKIVALDAVPFKIQDWNAKGHPKQGGQPAFHVFAAYGWDSSGDRGRLIALRAQPGFEFRQGVPYWANFLEELRGAFGGGMPEQIVVDPDEDTWKAIDLIWPPTLGPSPVVYVCHWHLRDRLLEILRQAGLDASDPLYVAGEHAFDWKERWDDFALLADQASIARLATWMKKWRQRIEFQLTHQAGRRVAVGPLEQQLTVIRNAFEDRRGSFKNRERLNRLLMLMQLDRNGQASETGYAKIIREHLVQQGGYSPPRRQILDPKGSPSLRL